jgi:perosamine synthetase
MSHPIAWWTPQMGGGELELVRQVLESNYLNEGDVTAAFERKIAEIAGARFAVAATSGTAALTLALKAAGVGAGDEVIVPDVTFVASANAVHLAGATPVLADVDANLGLDPAALGGAITSRTRAVMPVHVSGRAADMDGILEVSRAHGLAVIEDAAEALGSKWRGRGLGTVGLAGCFSFSPNKTITTGQGGMVVTDDPAVHARLVELKDQGRPVRGTGGDDLHHSIGFNFKLTNMQAAVGLAQLALLDQRIARITATYRFYARHLDGLDGLRLIGFRLAEGEVPQWVDAIVERRDELDAALRRDQIHCRRFWHPLHTQAPYRAAGDRFPNASRLAPRALWLPSAFTLSDDDLALVCERIRRFLGGT